MKRFFVTIEQLDDGSMHAVVHRKRPVVSIVLTIRGYPGAFPAEA